jgi:hypothetical protein
MSSSSCLPLLPLLPVTSTLPSIFPSMYVAKTLQNLVVCVLENLDIHSEKVYCFTTLFTNLNLRTDSGEGGRRVRNCRHFLTCYSFTPSNFFSPDDDRFYRTLSGLRKVKQFYNHVLVNLPFNHRPLQPSGLRKDVFGT